MNDAFRSAWGLTSHSAFRSSGGQIFCCLSPLEDPSCLSALLMWSVRSADQQEVMMSPQCPRVNPRFDWAEEKRQQRLNPAECVWPLFISTWIRGQVADRLWRVSQSLWSDCRCLHTMTEEPCSSFYSAASADFTSLELKTPNVWTVKFFNTFFMNEKRRETLSLHNITKCLDSI